MEDSSSWARSSIPMLVQNQSSKILWKVHVVCAALNPVQCPLESMVSCICISHISCMGMINTWETSIMHKTINDNKLGSILVT
jgi:hypothetical protein